MTVDTHPGPCYIRSMDVGLVNRWLHAPGPAGPHGQRDRVLVAVMAVAAADGGLTQARVLSMRVEEAPRVLGGTPFASKVIGAVRALAKTLGLAPTDPVFTSRKRDADGRRRPVSRVQAYRVLRTRAGTGWKGCLLRLVSTRRPVRSVPSQPTIRRPASTPADDLMARLEGRPRPASRPPPEYEDLDDRGEQEPDPDDYEQSADG